MFIALTLALCTFNRDICVQNRMALSPTAKIAVLPSPNLSKDKWEDLKQRESVEARNHVEDLFRERGFTVIGDSDIDSQVDKLKVDLKDEEQWTRANLSKLGRMAHANYVAFVAIRESRSKTIRNIFISRQAGEAQIELWLVDSASGKAVLDDVAKKAERLAPPPGATGLRLGAVRKAIEAALEPTLRDFPVIRKEDKQ